MDGLVSMQKLKSVLYSILSVSALEKLFADLSFRFYCYIPGQADPGPLF